MTILDIQIKNYKSISEWQTVEWDSSLMIFVGKNGSGKTSILEALAMIFEANSNTNFYHNERLFFDYKIIIKLSKTELAEIDSTLPFTPENCIVEAICEKGEQSLKINRIKSRTLVDAIRKHEGDVQDMAQRLSEKFASLSEKIDNMCSADTDGVPLFCIKVMALKNSTNYGHQIDGIKRNIDYKIEVVQKLLKQLIESDDALRIKYIYNPFEYLNVEQDFAFELKYIPPKLTKFECNYITIDEKKIIAEIERINKEVKAEREAINTLVNKINALLVKINRIAEQEEPIQDKENKKHFALIRSIQKKVRRRCFFLRNENSLLLFNEERTHGQDYGYSQSNIHERLIFEAYIKAHTKNNDERKALLESLAAGKLEINDRKSLCRDLEKVINKDIPAFDKGMYSSVKAEFDSNGRLSLHLVEQGGKEVDFNMTSTGRRWYFTYYFIKKCLKKDDILIIDEPAAFLHPQAQSEILADLESLSSRCKVIISTHSPYMISDKADSYYFVKMMDSGTVLKKHSIKDFAEARADMGFVNFNSLILESDKKYILVEGKHDFSVIKTFMRVFGVDSAKFEVFQLDGVSKANPVYRFIKTTAIDYVLMLDADAKEQQVDEIDRSKIVFVGEGTKELAIEGLFSAADKAKYFKSITTRQGKKSKVSPDKLQAKESESDFTEETIANFKKLFKQLGMI